MNQNKILLVDDDPDYLLLAGNFLRNEGLTVQTAASGEEALEHLAQQDFCLLITDLQMPRMDGLELARKVTELAPDMTIIMSTGSICSTIPRRARAAGISKVIAKTLPGEMLAAVREATEAPRTTNRRN